MNYANMIDEKNLKKGFIIATLISTIAGTFTTAINLVDRINEKRKQDKIDHEQDHKIKSLERRVSRAEGNNSDDDDDSSNNHNSRSRSRRRGSNNNDLRGSLETSGPLVRRQYDQYYSALGSSFAEGDVIAQNQLQSQIITLQSTVIRLLEDALMTGQMPDTGRLYNASEFAREGTIQALRDQYRRLLMTAQSMPPGRPLGLVRRTSSTPALRSIGYGGADDAYNSLKQLEWTPRRPQKALTFNRAGPLFCRYAEDLQRSNRALDPVAYGGGGDGACPACGTVLAVEPGRSWRVDKEVVRERVSRGRHDAEIVEMVEDRVFLLSNRFIVKCHREGAGFACCLCFRFREVDSLCRSMESLVKHVLEKHDIAEYETDEDIREVTMQYRQ